MGLREKTSSWRYTINMPPTYPPKTLDDHCSAGQTTTETLTTMYVNHPYSFFQSVVYVSPPESARSHTPSSLGEQSIVLEEHHEESVKWLHADAMRTLFGSASKAVWYASLSDVTPPVCTYDGTMCFGWMTAVVEVKNFAANEAQEGLCIECQLCGACEHPKGVSPQRLLEHLIAVTLGHRFVAVVNVRQLYSTSASGSLFPSGTLHVTLALPNSLAGFTKTLCDLLSNRFIMDRPGYWRCDEYPGLWSALHNHYKALGQQQRFDRLQGLPVSPLRFFPLPADRLYMM